MRHLLSTVGLMTALCFLLFALSIEADETAAPGVTLSNIVNGPSKTGSTARKPLIRMMPLGASITQGIDKGIPEDLQDGYRRPLRDELGYRGYPVEMVGARANGAFIDRQHEGYPGLKVDQVATNMLKTLTTQKPNLVTILLGTNDCVEARGTNDMEYARATKGRMRTLIERLFTESDGVAIILATLTPTRDDGLNPYIRTANTGYRELVQELQDRGRKIESAEMYSTWFTPDDYSDSTHFNNAGYKKMAAIFFDAFTRVEAKHWLTLPPAIAPPVFECYPSAKSFRGPVRTQQGSGRDDGDFIYSSTLESSKDFKYSSSTPRSLLGHFHFATLGSLSNEKQVRDELILVLDPEDRKGTNLPFLSFYRNRGDGYYYTTPTTFEVGQACTSSGVRWGDVNGDHLDDFICVDADGIPHVSLNRGGDPPQFEFIGAIRDGKTSQSKVRLADIDGDGRLDFCTVESNGTSCWRNGGTGDAPTGKYGGFWQGMLLAGGGRTLDTNPALDPAGTRFIDINGDGRADWIYIHENATSEIRINQRGDRSDGKGLKPHWDDRSIQKDSWPVGDKVSRDNILFGRIFGSGRQDVVHLERVADTPDFVFHFYRNTGHGDTQVRGDGVRYCDMYGRGYDDYLWVSSDGKIELFENIQTPPKWKSHGQILDTRRDRKYLHIGDWDGDGLCDILSVDRETGNVDVWRNTYKKGAAVPTFAKPIRVVDISACGQSDAQGSLYDLAVRFADLDGDKRVDYICTSPSGTFETYLNTPSGLRQLPHSTPIEIESNTTFFRAELRWADVTGNSRADLLHVNAHTGTITTWINTSNSTNPTDFALTWSFQPSIFPENLERGANLHFPKLGKSGRADVHVVYPRTGIADTWFNDGECVNGGGGGGGVGGGAPDDGPVRDPELPVPPKEM
ncbi:carbohydrate esterase family 3 protein [Paraphoma chrysanthemicola]|nr:carbohydrate esterase family 3 protein [Paraphoma chrysanthemicola]